MDVVSEGQSNARSTHGLSGVTRSLSVTSHVRLTTRHRRQISVHRLASGDACGQTPRFFLLPPVLHVSPLTISIVANMAEQGELAFVKSFTNALSSQPVVYGNDYQPAPESELKRVPVLPVSCHHAACIYALWALRARSMTEFSSDLNRSTSLRPQNEARQMQGPQVRL